MGLFIKYSKPWEECTPRERVFPADLCLTERLPLAGCKFLPPTSLSRFANSPERVLLHLKSVSSLEISTVFLKLRESLVPKSLDFSRLTDSPLLYPRTFTASSRRP